MYFSGNVLWPDGISGVFVVPLFDFRKHKREQYLRTLICKHDGGLSELNSSTMRTDG